jgi:hypothetical protein
MVALVRNVLSFITTDPNAEITQTLFLFSGTGLLVSIFAIACGLDLGVGVL